MSDKLRYIPDGSRSQDFSSVYVKDSVAIALAIIILVVIILIFYFAVRYLTRSLTTTSAVACSSAPPVPQNVTASYVSSSRFRVDWNSGDGLAENTSGAYFIVYVGTSPGFDTGNSLISKTSTGTTTNIDNLPQNTFYYIRVQSINKCGESALSSEYIFNYSSP